MILLSKFHSQSLFKRKVINYVHALEKWSTKRMKSGRADERADGYNLAD